LTSYVTRIIESFLRLRAVKVLGANRKREREGGRERDIYMNIHVFIYTKCICMQIRRTCIRVYTTQKLAPSIHTP